MADKTGVFISYRRQSPSTHCANALRRELQRRYPGAEVFHDGVSLEAGTEWPERIREALDDSAVLLALVDENWATVRKGPRLRLDMEGDWVRRELVHAFENGTHVIPILIGDAGLPKDRDHLPSCLHPIFDRQTRKLRDDDPRDHENDLKEFVAAVGNHLPAAAAEAPTPGSAPRAVAAPTDHISLEDAVALILEIAPGPRELYDLADARYDVGAHRLSEMLYRAAAEQFAEEVGPEDRWTLSTRHNTALALLSQGKTAQAETLVNELIPLCEQVYGPEDSYTLAILRQALAQACLEQGAADRAREALAPLPADGGDPDPVAQGSFATLRAWLADLDGDAARAEELLNQADAHLAHLTPEHYIRRELTKYRETRVPGGPGGTMVWSPDAVR